MLSFEEIMARKRERQNRETSSDRGRGRRSMSPDRRRSPAPRREREDVRGVEHHHDRHSRGHDGDRHDRRDDVDVSAASARPHRDLDRSDHTSFRGRDDRARGDGTHSHERSLNSDPPRGHRNDRYDDDTRGGRAPKELAEPPIDPKLRPLDDDPRGGKMYRQTTHGRKGKPSCFKSILVCDFVVVGDKFKWTDWHHKMADLY